MKSKLKFSTSGLSICFLLMLLRPAHAEEPSMVQLESVLSALSGYSYGEPETWKPELLESMREIYQDPGLYDRALRRLKDFQNSSVSDAAKKAVERYIENLSEATSHSEKPETYEMAAILDLVSKSDRSRKDDETILKAAEQFADQGKTIEAVSLYRQIYNLGQDVELRAAALRGEFALSEDKVAFIKHAIQEAPAVLKDHANRLVKSLPASFKKGKDLLKLPGLSDTDCIQILAQLAKRSDPSIHAEVISYARSDSELFRTTSLEALSQVGKPEDLPLLVEKVSNGSATEAKLAEEALYQIRGKQFDEAIVEDLTQATGKEQETLLRAVEKRNIESATPMLLKLINGSDSKLASRALSTLTLVSGIPGLKAVVDQWIQENDDRRIKELDRAITRMTVRLQDNRETLGILKQAQSASLPETKKTTLMELLGKLEK